MSKVDDCRRNAAEIMRLAQRTSTTEDKSKLMKLAEAWLDLADHTIERARGADRLQRAHAARREQSDQRPDDP